MNKRQVIILWCIALVLGAAVATVKLSQKKATDISTRRTPGQTLFESFPANEVATVEIRGVKGTTTLVKKDGAWVIPDRSGYPAKSSVVNEFLRSLADLKVTRGMEAGPSLAPRFGMDESATTAEAHGLTATFKDGSGKELAAITLGKNVDNGAQANPMMGGFSGRFIRNQADDSGFYAVSELFPEITDGTANWLAPDFLSVEKIRSVTVSQPGKTDTDWKASRTDESAGFKLENSTETLAKEKDTALKSLFSYSSFVDVPPAATVAARILPETTRKVVIETFEGFTYQITLSSAKPVEAAPEPGQPARETAFLTVEVSATLPTERKKEANEKPEDATAKDQAFTARLKTLTEKLEKEKKFSGHTFEIEKQNVETLLLPRKEVLMVPAPATAQPPAAVPGNP